MQLFDGRVAVVTGAASGIGLAIVEAFAAEGMRVVMSDVNEERLNGEAARLRESGAELDAVVADVSDPKAVIHGVRAFDDLQQAG